MKGLKRGCVQVFTQQAFEENVQDVSLRKFNADQINPLSNIISEKKKNVMTHQQNFCLTLLAQTANVTPSKSAALPISFLISSTQLSNASKLSLLPTS